jgi:phosphoglycolate phosphatase-like HAD superfamily hydrolase
MVDTVIFDFDGVIADSGEDFAEALQEVMKRPEPFSDEEIKTLRGSSAQEVIKILGVKKWQLPNFVIKGKRGIAARISRVEVFQGIPDAIHTLDKEGYKLYILSTNSEAGISGILSRNKLNGYFSGIYSGAGIFGKSKRLKALLRKERLSKTQCVYVGDETRDIEAAKKAGLKSVAVEWGYNAPDALKSYSPDVMAAKPTELVKAIAELKKTS